MKKTIAQLENELRGRKRINESAKYALYKLTAYQSDKGSFWSEKFKR